MGTIPAFPFIFSEKIYMIPSKPITKYLFIAFYLFLSSCDTGKLSMSDQFDWYRTYSGKTGDKEIVLHLSKANNYKGYIWIKDTQYPVMVYSDPTITPGNDSIYLNGGNANHGISFKGILKDNIIGEMSIKTNGVQNPAEKVNLSPDDSFTAFDFIHIKTNAKLPKKLNNESTFEYFMGTVWPWEKELSAEKLKLPIKELMGIPSSETDISVWMDSLTKSSYNRWRAEGNKLTPEDAAIMGMSFSEQVLNYLGVMYENEETITLANYVYVYEGGAHGNYSTTLLNIDKTSGKKLSIKDILSPEGIKALPGLLDTSARKQYQITNSKPLEDNGFFINTLKPTENFYVTSRGVGFYYTPYEIKPFSDGEINLFIPKEVLKDYWIK